jgi:SAM-dependent methyltransferase
MTMPSDRPPVTMPLSYFEDLYAASSDPWSFETRWYERRKHALTVACLPQPKYRRAFEPACSNGRLTSLLAPRCAELLAVDGVASAVRRAQKRLARQSHVQVEQRDLPQQWPAGPFDLIVVSEFLYYLAEAALPQLMDLIHDSLEPDGTLVAVHWRHPVAEYPLTGDAVHDMIRAHPGLALLAKHEEEDFLIDVLVRRDKARTTPSVAARTGVPGVRSRS